MEGGEFLGGRLTFAKGKNMQLRLHILPVGKNKKTHYYTAPIYSTRRDFKRIKCPSRNVYRLYHLLRKGRTYPGKEFRVYDKRRKKTQA